MSAQRLHTTERWRFDPPEPATGRYDSRRYQIHLIDRTIDHRGEIHYSFHGVPLSKVNGKPVGSIGYRYLAEDDRARLIAMIPEPTATWHLP